MATAKQKAAAMVAVLLLVSARAIAQGPPQGLPHPPKSAPFKWPNEHGQMIECKVTPWQKVDLGKVGPTHIYAGDHCSMPSPDPISGQYKKVFMGSCDLHDICYFGPGNSKTYCDNTFKWHMDRDCEHAYPSALGKKQCHVAALAWRKGLDTSLSSQYWVRSQDWGKHHCQVAPTARK